MPKRGTSDDASRDHRDGRGDQGVPDHGYGPASGDGDAAGQRYAGRNGHGRANQHTDG
jgi:hypothetical protein